MDINGYFHAPRLLYTHIGQDAMLADTNPGYEDLNQSASKTVEKCRFISPYNKYIVEFRVENLELR